MIRMAIDLDEVLVPFLRPLAIRRRVYEDVFSRSMFTPVEPIVRNARLELRYRELLDEPIHTRTAATWDELDELEDSIMRLGQDPSRFWA